MKKEFSEQRFSNTERQSSDIFSELKEERKAAPKITELRILNLASVAERYSVEIEDLENIFAEKFESWAIEISTSGVSAKKMEMVDTLFHLFNISKSNQEVPDWIRAFSSWDLFIQKYGTSLSKKQKEAVRKYVDWFIDRIAQPQMILKGDPQSTDPYRFRLETYYSKGDWILMPEEGERYGMYTYVDETVIKEVILLLEQGYHSPDYTHASGSAALEEIENDTAILSSTALIELGKHLKTGERSFYPNETGGLGSVYVDYGDPRYGYHTLSWFDEYAVTFGINRSRHEKDQDKRNTKYSGNQHSIDLGSEGIIIGPRVSLGSVEIIYCWKRYENKIKEWMQKNTPQAKLASLEAVETLSQYRALFSDYADKNGKTEKEVWEMLFEKKY